MVHKTNLFETGTCQKVRFSSRQGTPPPLPPRQRHTRSRYPQDNGTPTPHQNTLQATSGAPTVGNPYGWHTLPPPQASPGHIGCADVLRIVHQHPARPQKTPHSTNNAHCDNVKMGNLAKNDHYDNVKMEILQKRQPRGCLPFSENSPGRNHIPSKTLS